MEKNLLRVIIYSISDRMLERNNECVLCISTTHIHMYTYTHTHTLILTLTVFTATHLIKHFRHSEVSLGEK